LAPGDSDKEIAIVDNHYPEINCQNPSQNPKLTTVDDPPLA
jgi:hypothetical protein